MESNLFSHSNFKYYSTYDFNNSVDINDNCTSTSFSALHCNIRSLGANCDKLMNMLNELHHGFSVIGLSEIKFTQDKEVLSNISVPGYNFISQPSLSSAGGVGMYLKNNIKFVQRDDLSFISNLCETLWIEIKNPKQKNILCAVMYRHPSTSIDLFTEHLNETLNKIEGENKYCFLMGDFNINLLNYDSHSSTEIFFNSLTSSFFHPLISGPTRVTNHSATLIDNIFFNSLEHYTISGNLLYDLSDHLPNFVIINKFCSLPPKVKLFKRDYRNFDEETFKEEFQSIDWSGILTGVNINELFNSFYSKTSDIVDKHLPLIQLNKHETKSLSKPWITSAIRKSIAIKNRYLKKFIKTNNPLFHSKFKLYRNKLNHLIKRSKKLYYNNYFLKNSTNTKAIWKGIRNVINLKASSFNMPSKIIHEGVTKTDTKSIADAFNEYFVNIGSDLDNAIPQSNVSFSEYLDPPQPNTFFLYPTNSLEIQNEIMSLSNNKSTGLFSIPVNILKLINLLISGPLEIIFNYSFSTGTIPDAFKIAKVIPIYKKGSRLTLGNYRPISLLSVFNKLLEKLVFKRLIDFLNKFDILYDYQFGFRPKHSTNHTLLLITDKIQKAIEDNKFACGVFLDLCKAFDTVNHDILISKLDCYGIRGIAKDWFCSYLSNRKQYVYIGDIISNCKNINYGVPQGSVLGPLLFLLYINDFQNCSNLTDFHLFADDTNLFYADESISNLEITVNNELKKINTWFCANRLSLNVDKSNYVIFHPPQKKFQTIFLHVNSITLKREKSVKYLGVFLDEHLSWKSHTTQVSKKISRGIGILSKIRYFVHENILIQLYYSLVYPFLIYGLLTWGNTYENSIKSVIILQKKAIRIMNFSDYNSHTSGLFKKLGLLKFKDIVFLQNALFMYKFHHQALPHVFDNFFTPVSGIHKYSTRLADDETYYVNNIRTNYGKFNVRFFGAKTWNSVPREYKSLGYSMFKKKLTCDFLLVY